MRTWGTLGTFLPVVTGWSSVRVVLRVTPSLVRLVLAVRVSVTEQLRGQTHSVTTGRLAPGTDGFVSVQQRLRGELTDGHVAIVYSVGPVTDLPLDVECEAGAALEGEHLPLYTEIVLSALLLTESQVPGCVGIPIKFPVVHTPNFLSETFLASSVGVGKR